jgi:hypothetical protein
LASLAALPPVATESGRRSNRNKGTSLLFAAHIINFRYGPSFNLPNNFDKNGETDMGGMGSGHYWRWNPKATTGDLEMHRRWTRTGHLEPFRRFFLGYGGKATFKLPQSKSNPNQTA